MRSVRSLWVAVWRVVGAILRREPVLASQKTREIRVETCEICDRFDERSRRCRDCGCFVDVKAVFKTERCPHKFWEVIDGSKD